MKTLKKGSRVFLKNILSVKKIKFLTKTNMTDYVAEDNMLEDWGGSDTWQYVWQPEESGAGGGGAEGNERN